MKKYSVFAQHSKFSGDCIAEAFSEGALGSVQKSSSLVIINNYFTSLEKKGRKVGVV